MCLGLFNVQLVIAICEIKEYMDLNAQLNATINLLTKAIIQKDQALADMQKQLDEMMEELKLLQKELLGR